MIILGALTYSHDSSAALVKDGRLLYAAEEERFNGEKHTSQFPHGAIQACLDHVKITIDDVDVICVPTIPDMHIRLKFIRHWLRNYPKVTPRMLTDFEWVHKILNIEKDIREKLNFKKEVFFCHHHTAHMASAYYLSGFSHSALLSVDGVGDIESLTVGLGENNNIKMFKDGFVEWPHSLGVLYTCITGWLGFKRKCDEGKVMGLAPYGNPETYRATFEKIVTLLPKGRFNLDLSYFDYPYIDGSTMSAKFAEICGSKREPKDEITQRHMDVAAGVQEITEKTLVHAANYLHKKTGEKNICLAGGVALNCVANGKILTETPFENIFVQPAANDAGISAGAALFYHYKKNPLAPRYKMEHAYLGTGYTDERIEAALTKKSAIFEKHSDLLSLTAQYLADQKIIAWFNGRMEYGPRALGNRSILTAPFPAEMKDVLNSRVKHRESFRPFAPIVLEEDCGEYFDNTHESPFMLLTYGVRKDKQDKVPAITHVDGTARVQTINERQNPDLYKLVKGFKVLTGISVILNTSFNVMGQPIVNTPEEAIDCFLSTDIDYLVLNAKYLLKK